MSHWYSLQNDGHAYHLNPLKPPRGAACIPRQKQNTLCMASLGSGVRVAQGNLFGSKAVSNFVRGVANDKAVFKHVLAECVFCGGRAWPASDLERLSKSL